MESVADWLTGRLDDCRAGVTLGSIRAAKAPSRSAAAVTAVESKPGEAHVEYLN